MDNSALNKAGSSTAWDSAKIKQITSAHQDAIEHFTKHLWEEIYEKYGCQRDEECLYGVLRSTTTNGPDYHFETNYFIAEVFDTPEKAIKCCGGCPIIRVSKEKWSKLNSAR